jgi:hypothetical protein
MIITPTRARRTATTDLIISSAEFSSALGRGSTDFMGRAVTATTVAVIMVAVIMAAATTDVRDFAGISVVEETGTSADPGVVTSKAVEAESSTAVEVETSAVAGAATSAAAEAAVAPMVPGPAAADAGKAMLIPE